MGQYFIWGKRLKTEFEDTLIWAIGTDGIHPIEAFKDLEEAKQRCDWWNGGCKEEEPKRCKCCGGIIK